MVRESLSDKVTFEKNPEGNEGMNRVSMWKKGLQGRQIASTKALRQTWAEQLEKSHLKPVGQSRLPEFLGSAPKTELLK